MSIEGSVRIMPPHYQSLEQDGNPCVSYSGPHTTRSAQLIQFKFQAANSRFNTIRINFKLIHS